MKEKKRYYIDEVGDYIPINEYGFFINKDGDYDKSQEEIEVEQEEVKE